MGLLRDIQNAAAGIGPDHDRPLAAVLRITKILAVRLDNPMLAEWVDHELNGYPPESALPPYRAKRQTMVQGNFSGPMRSFSNNIPIPSRAIPAEHRDSLFHIEFRDPVAAYEAMLERSEGILRAPWSGDAVARFGGNIMHMMTCLGAWQVVPHSDVVGVLDGVRNRIVDLTLELEREAPAAGDVPSAELPVTREQVDNIVSMTIFGGARVMTDNSVNVGGAAGNVVGGQGNIAQQGDVTINQQSLNADLPALLENLHLAVEKFRARVEPEYAQPVQELVQAFDEEAAKPQPRKERLVAFLQGLAPLATSAGAAGGAVIDAVQEVQKALGT